MHIFTSCILYLTILSYSYYPSVNSAEINFVFLWSEGGVASAADALFKRVFYKDYLLAKCPNNTAILSSTFHFSEVTSDSLFTVTDVQKAVETLKTKKILFAGSELPELGDIFESAEIQSPNADFGFMRVHTVSPKDITSAIPAFEKVIDNQIPEKPENFINKEAIFVLGRGYELHNFGDLLKRFNHGIYYYYLAAGQEKEVATKVKERGIKNIFLAASQNLASNFINECYKSQLLTYSYRWFIYRTRLVDRDYNGIKIPSKNITSLEFGPVDTIIQKNLTSDLEIIVYDTLTIWTTYLAKQFCNYGFVGSREVYDGLTGHFELFSNGSIIREYWKMNIYRGLGTEREKVGNWSSDGIFHMLPHSSVDLSNRAIIQNLRKNKLRIVTILDKPYVEYKPFKENSTEPLHLKLQGYAIDICVEILKRMNITDYEFYFQPDGKYGNYSYNAAGKRTWNGIVGTLVDGAADLACGNLSPTPERKQFVSFTVDILTYQFSVLYKKTIENPLRAMFEFFNPLHEYVWAALAGVLVFMAIMLSVLHFLSPNKNEFNISNSLFFSIASFVQGITGNPPDKLSGMILVAFFWLFVLVILIVYVTHYAAIRTLNRLQAEIETIDNLLDQSTYKYGILSGTNLVDVFRNSTVTYMQEIYKKMSEDFVNGMLPNTSVALELVKEGNFAFIGSATNEYYKKTECNLIVSAAFSESSVALGTPLNAEYLSVLTENIKQLGYDYQNTLRNKYFDRENSRPNCVDTRFPYFLDSYIPKETGILQSKKGTLGLADTLGIAVINIVGCVFTLLIAFFEWLILTCKRKWNQMKEKKEIKDRKNREKMARAQRNID